MFTAFAGVEKFLNVQVVNRIKGKFGMKNNMKTYMLADYPVLTAGDIAVMQAMHAVETGKIPYDSEKGEFHIDWLGVFQGMAFRIGMRGTESLVANFPNFAQKFKEKYGDIKDRVRKNTPMKDLVPEGSFHAGDEMAHGARLEPAGKNSIRQ
jgi:hypothetical protein